MTWLKRFFKSKQKAINKGEKRTFQKTPYYVLYLKHFITLLKCCFKMPLQKHFYGFLEPLNDLSFSFGNVSSNIDLAFKFKSV